MRNGKPTITYRRDIEVRYETDVLVVGGGPAGVAAAMVVQDHTNTRGIDVKDLQKRLKTFGAFLPNYKDV